MVDTRDLKSLGQKWLYEFESRPRHQKNATALRLHSFVFFAKIIWIPKWHLLYLQKRKNYDGYKYT